MFPNLLARVLGRSTPSSTSNPDKIQAQEERSRRVTSLFISTELSFALNLVNMLLDISSPEEATRSLSNQPLIGAIWMVLQHTRRVENANRRLGYPIANRDIRYDISPDVSQFSRQAYPSAPSNNDLAVAFQTAALTLFRQAGFDMTSIIEQGETP